MATKEQELLSKYLGDMIALESHILQAIDKQAKLLDDHASAQQKVHAYRDTLAGHVETLKQRMDELGGSTTHPVKEGVAAAFGVAAGLIDKVRSEEASKDLRDDYTAINHSAIAYEMMYTTAVAAGDMQTAEICRRHLADNARFVMEISAFMPQLVIEELRQDGMAVKPDALTMTEQMIREVWGSQAQTGI